MIFEDAHWIDPTSLEALGRTVDRISTPGRVVDRYVSAGTLRNVDSIGDQTASGVLAAALVIAFSAPS
jgi:predicted ATPase